MFNMNKWIVDTRCTKHMTLYKCSFNTYQLIVVIRVWLGDNGLVDAIGLAPLS